MKTYKIINSDIMLKGKLFPEGTTINLDDKDAQSLASFLVILSEVEGSFQDGHPELARLDRSNSRQVEGSNNKQQKIRNNKRNK